MAVHRSWKKKAQKYLLKFFNNQYDKGGYLPTFSHSSMKTKSLKPQIATFLAIILFLAMLLISLVWGMFLKKNMVEKEIIRLEDALDTVQENAGKSVHPSDAKQVSAAAELLKTKGIQCIFLKMEGGQAVREDGIDCFPDALLAEIESETIKKKQRTIAYHGTSWAVFTFSHRQVLVGKPLFDTQGGVSGVVIVGSSLEPLYAKIREQSKVVLFYLIINTIIFAGIGLLRMMQIVMKPIERFIMLSKQYTPSSPNFFLEDTNNEFANLSNSLNNLFSRIREDNEKLRKTVALLESANLQLERNKDEMVRTEKLAAIGRLSAGLAHEIGNPLSIILGYVDLLRRADLGGEERETFSANAQLELDRIKNLIRQLLDFARVENLPEQCISVHDLINQVTIFVAMEKSFAHCNIIQQLDAERDTVTTHVDSLRQVLLNCLLNAADSLQGSLNSREIIISTTNVDKGVGHDLLHMSIKDNGTGIAVVHLENVFDPFFTTKEPGQGTGLGLFVCHTIIEKLGGSITIHNNPGGEKGVEVVITLPLKNDLQSSSN